MKKKTEREPEPEPENISVDQTEIAKLRGSFRQLIKHHGKLSRSEKDFMISWLEVTRDCIRRLGKKRMSLNEYDALLSVYESELLPELEGLIGPIDQLMEKAEDKDDLEPDRQSQKSITVSYLRKIARNPKKDLLIEEKMQLLAMNKELNKKSISRETLDNINTELLGSIIPSIDVICEEEKRKSTDDDDDEYGMSKKDLKRLRMKKEALKLEKEIAVMGTDPQSAIVTRTSPKMDPSTGELLKNPDGSFVMETVSGPAGQVQAGVDPMNTFYMSTIISLLNTKTPDQTEQNTTPEMARMREDLAESRRREKEAEARAREERDRREAEYRERMERQMMGLANRNPFREYHEMKREMIGYGLEPDRNRTAEEKSARMAQETIQEVSSKIDTRISNLERTGERLLNAQLESVKNQQRSGVNVPVIPHNTEQQKVQIYEELLRIDDLEDNE